MPHTALCGTSLFSPSNTSGAKTAFHAVFLPHLFHRARAIVLIKELDDVDGGVMNDGRLLDEKPRVGVGEIVNT